jgi:peptide/nickel transport system substrate-binding protein
MPVEEIARSSYGDTNHVGSGPFTVAKWSQGSEIAMVRNDHFFGRPAYLDKIVLRFVADPREVMSSLSTGELDVGIDLPETSVVDLRQIPNVNVANTPKAGAVDLLAINLNDPENLSSPNPILADLAVRRAMLLGFNRQKIVDDFLAGQTSVAITPLDNTRWLAPDLKPYPYDPGEAQQALNVAGWITQSDGVRAKKGIRLSVTLVGVQGDSPEAVLEQRIEKAFVSDMAAIGIQVEQRSVPADELNADLNSGGILANRAFDVVNVPNDARGGPARFAARFHSQNTPSTLNPTGSNVMGYSSIVVDAAIEGESRAVDQQSRAELLYAAQRTIFNDIPVIPVYDHFQVDAGRSYVHGLKPGPVSGLWWDTEDWWVNRQDASP